MAITSARVYLDGQWYALEYNANTARWEATVVPARSSYHQDGGYFPVTIEATNDSGTVVTAGADENEWLRLQVKDKIAPTITMESEYPGGYITTQTPTFVFFVGDTDSGVNASTISARVDDGATAYTLSHVEADGGYRVTYTSTEALSEGTHVFTATVKDYDGNVGTFSAEYVVDVTPPELYVFSPHLNYLVDVPEVRLTGKALDVTTPPVRAVCSCTTLGEFELLLDANGIFSSTIPLAVGHNDITVTVTDSAGLVSRSEFFMVRLITDREELDVENAKELMAKPVSQWSAEDARMFNTAVLRGSYDYVDINRVTEAMEYLDEAFRDNGIESGYVQIKPIWYESDIMQPSAAAQYLANLASLRALVSMPENAPVVPDDMEGLNFQEANDIEKILVLIDAVFYYIDKAFWYSGEVLCGEN